MKENEIIEHCGVVYSIDDQYTTVQITSHSACSACHAKGMCDLSGKEDKMIKVAGKYKVSLGETVKVLMQQSMGFQAVFLGYFLPFIVLTAILILMVSLSVSELLSGLIAIASLIPYYIILFIFKSRLDKKFTFTIKTD